MTTLEKYAGGNAVAHLFARPIRDHVQPIDGGALKSGIVFFWSSWTTIIVLMNLMDELKALGLLPEDWNVASGNYKAIAHETDVYRAPAWLDKLLLFGAMLWEAVASCLFWRAFRLHLKRSPESLAAGYTASACLLGLFGAFILGDEILHAYKMEGDHREIAQALLMSLLALQYLPESGPTPMAKRSRLR